MRASSSFDDLIRQASTPIIDDSRLSIGKLSLDDIFMRGVVGQESGGVHRTAGGNLLTSPKGAQGIAQLMPKTQRDPGFGVKPLQNDTPEEHLRFGRDYLKAMARHFGDTQLGLAAYNAGAGTVEAAVRRDLAAGGDGTFASVARFLPKETRDYVPGVLNRIEPQDAKPDALAKLRAEWDANGGQNMHRADFDNFGAFARARMKQDAEAARARLLAETGGDGTLIQRAANKAADLAGAAGNAIGGGIGERLARGVANLPTDLGLGIAKGVTSIASFTNELLDTLTGPVADGFFADLARAGVGNSEYFARQQSPELQAQRQNLTGGDGFTDTLARVGQNPLAVLDLTAEQVPQIGLLGGVMGAARGAATGAQAVGRMAAANVATGGVLGGADAANSARAQVLGMSEQQLAEGSDLYRAYREQGLDHNAAQDVVARYAALRALPMGALTGVVASRLGANLEAGFLQRLTGQAEALTARQVARALPATIGKEFAEEAIDEGFGSQYGSNIGVKTAADANISLLDDVGKSAALGGVLGVVMGGGMGALDLVGRERAMSRQEQLLAVGEAIKRRQAEVLTPTVDANGVEQPLTPEQISEGASLKNLLDKLLAGDAELYGDQGAPAPVTAPQWTAAPNAQAGAPLQAGPTVNFAADYPLPTPAPQIDTADVDAAVAAGSQARAAQQRMAILDAVLADDSVQNPSLKFAAELRRAGIKDSNPSDGELSRIESFLDAREAFSQLPEGFSQNGDGFSQPPAVDNETDWRAQRDGLIGAVPPVKENDVLREKITQTAAPAAPSPRPLPASVASIADVSRDRSDFYRRAKALNVPGITDDAQRRQWMVDFDAYKAGTTQRVTPFAQGENAAASLAQQGMQRQADERVTPLTGNPFPIAKPGKSWQARASQVDPERDTVRQAIARLGGLRKDQALAEWGKTLVEGVHSKVWGKALFRSKGGEGMSLDDAREALVELGYLPEGADINDLYDVFDADAAHPLRAEREAEAMFAAQQGEEADTLPDEQADPLDPALSHDPLLDGADGWLPDAMQDDAGREQARLTEAEDAALAALVADIRAKLGDEADDLLEQASMMAGDGSHAEFVATLRGLYEQGLRSTGGTTGSKPEEGAGRALPNLETATDQVGRRQGDQEGTGEFALAGQTEQELKAADAAQRRAELNAQLAAKQAEQRAQADAEVGSFTLAGSSRETDEVTARGQEGLAFDTPATVTAAPQPAPTKAQPTTDAPAAAPAQLKAEPAETANSPEPASATTTPAAKIEDYGSIGGARKDIVAAAREKLAAMLPDNDADITLTSHFPELDYARMLEQGVDVRVLALYKAIRDEIPAKPRKAYKLASWAKQVKMVRELAMMALDGSLPVDALLAKMRAAGRVLDSFADRVELYAALGYPAFARAREVLFEKGNYSMAGGVSYPGGKVLWRVRPANTESRYFDSLQGATEYMREVLGVPKEGDKATKGTKFDLYARKSAPDRTIIGKKIGKTHVDLMTFDSDAEALAYLKDHQAELEQLLADYKKTSYERGLSNRPREGAARRSGNVDLADFARQFGFDKRLQVGNAMPQGERQAHVNQAYDAMADLAELLGVPPAAMSLNGSLGIGFGTHGKGGNNAPAAHYAPELIAINLTRKHGSGSLGHEWWHALDNYFSRMRGNAGGFVSDNPRALKVPGENRKLVDDARVRPELLTAWQGVMQAIRASGMEQRAMALDERRSKPYWATPAELSARAFERFLIDKAKAAGLTNDYLANIVPQDVWDMMESLTHPGKDTTYPYPTDAEAPAINLAIQRFVDTLQTRDEGGNVMLYSVDPLAPVFAARDAAAAASEEFDRWVNEDWANTDGEEAVTAHSERLDARMATEAALVDAIEALPEPGFAAHGKTHSGWPVILTQSAKVPGRWQVTRFGHDGLPHWDSEYTNRAHALREMVNEIDLATLEVAIENADYRRNSIGSQGTLTTDQLRGVLTNGKLGGLIGKLIDAGFVVLHEDTRTLPDPNAPAEAAGLTDGKGVMHLVSGNLTADTALPTLLHELFHAGGVALLDTEFGATIARLRKLMEAIRKGGGSASEFLQRAEQRVAYAAELGVAADDISAEEFGAYAIEEYAYAPASVKKWVDGLLGKVKSWLLRRFGLQVGKVTAGQLHDLAIAILKDFAAGVEAAAPGTSRTAAYSFAGEQAKTADKGKLAQAKAIADGRGPSGNYRAWQTTGWFQGVDGLWRFEIDDSTAELRGAGDTIGERMAGVATTGDGWARMADVLDHPALFDAYPRLANTLIRVLPAEAMDGAQGSYDGTLNAIDLLDSLPVAAAKSVILHELQHGIQRFEGFANGGRSSDSFAAYIRDLLNDKARAAGQAVESWKYAYSGVIKRKVEVSNMAVYALMYESAERLVNYAHRDSPSGVMRLIRAEFQWLYQEQFRGDDEAMELQREVYRIPKPSNLKKRNEFLADFALRVAQVIRRQVPADVQQAFKADGRPMKLIVAQLRRQADKARKEVAPLATLDSQAKEAARLHDEYQNAHPYAIYEALAGEAEARLVQARMALGLDARAGRFPMSDFDVQPERQIVHFRGTRSASIAIPDTIDVDGKQRPTRNSDGKAIHPSETGVRNFWRWFGDSKVVDAEGRPLVMYHGTSKDADFAKFKVGKRGAWFTSNSESASDYAEENDNQDLKINHLTGKYEKVNHAGRVLPVYLKIESPYALTSDDRIKVNVGNYAKAQRDLFAGINGHDGILWNDALTKEWVVLRGDTQIKSALGNNGDFSPGDGRIAYSVAQRASATAGTAAPAAQPSGSTASSPTPPAAQGVAADPALITPTTRLERELEAHFDRFQRVRDVQGQMADQGVAIPAGADIADAQVSYSGRRSERLHDFKRKLVNPLVELMADAGLTPDRLDWYLLARHAEERNAHIARVTQGKNLSGSGVATADAAALLAGRSVTIRVPVVDAQTGVVTQTPVTVPGFAGKELKAMQDAAAIIDKMTATSRRLMLGYGLEDAAKVVGWEAMYQHYVPLAERAGEDTGGGAPGTATGFSVRGGQKRAAGRTTIAPNVTEQVLRQVEDTITRGEKNRVAQTVAAQASLLGDTMPEVLRGGRRVPLFEVNPTELRVHFRGAEGLSAKEIEAMAADEYGVARSELTGPMLRDFMRQSAANASGVPFASVTDADVKAWRKGFAGTVSREAMQLIRNAPDIVAARHNGRDVLVRVNDADMAAALRNLNASEADGLIRFMTSATSTLAMTYTSLSPLFWGKALLRDLSSVATLGQRYGGDAVAAAFKALPGAMAEAARYHLTHKESAEYRAFRMHGGRTGFVQTERNLADKRDALVDAIRKRGPLSAKNAGAKAIHLLRVLRHYLITVPDSFESGVRFAFYQGAVKAGMTQEQAARAAKEVTVNFNRSGAGDMTKHMRAYFPFYNAALQGTRTTGIALQDRRVQMAVLTLGALALLSQALLLAGMDDDERKALLDNPTFQRERASAILIPTGSDERPYVILPVEQNLAFVTGPANAIADLMFAGGDAWAAAKSIGRSLAVMLPPGIGNVTNAAVYAEPDERGKAMAVNALPAVIAPIGQSMLNVNWMGQQIVPENGYQTADPDAYKALRRNRTGWMSDLAIWLNEATGGNVAKEGMADVSPETISHYIRAYTGGIGASIMQGADIAANEQKGALDFPLWSGLIASPERLERGQNAVAYQQISDANEQMATVRKQGKAGLFAEAQADIARLRAEGKLDNIAAAEAADRQLKALNKIERRLGTRDDARAMQIRADLEARRKAVLAKLYQARDR